MDNSIEQIFVGSVVAFVGAVAGAIASAVINLLLAGKIPNNLWVLGGSAVVGAFLLYAIYQTNRFPFKKWRVTNVEDGKGLLARRDFLELDGRPDGETWQFKASICDCAIYGPYLRLPLQKGKYRATYRVKINEVSKDNQLIIELSIASNIAIKGDKQLAARTLSILDFKKGGVYQAFPLDFDIFTYERDLELRIFSKGSGHLVTLDYVRLSRRLF